MKNLLLLPNGYKRIGWVILLISLGLGVIRELNGHESFVWEARVFAIVGDELFGKAQYFNFIQTDILPTILGSSIIIGGLLVGFSKEKNEDEFIASLRQSSLLWAVLVNYLLLLFSFLFIYGMPFLSVMLHNIFSVLIIYIVRFNYVLYRKNK